MPTLDNYSLSNYGLGGPGGVKYATGSVVTSTSQASFQDTGGNYRSLYYVRVLDAIPFRPTRIILRRKNHAVGELMLTYNASLRDALPYNGDQNNYNVANCPLTGLSGSAGSTVFAIKVFELPNGTGDVGAYVTDRGFYMPYPISNTEIIWEAYG